MADYTVLTNTTAGNRQLKKGARVRDADLTAWGADPAKMAAAGLLAPVTPPPAPPKAAPSPEPAPTVAPAPSVLQT
jgi:hypothetical protein